MGEPRKQASTPKKPDVRSPAYGNGVLMPLMGMTFTGPRRYRSKAAPDKSRISTTGKRLKVRRFGAHRPSYLRDKNPLIESSLRLRDVHPGTSFVCYNEWCGVWATGTFLSYPTAHPSATSRMRWTGLWVVVRLHGIGPRLIELSSLGIIPDANSYWNDYCAVVSPRKRSLLPNPTNATAKAAARLIASRTLPISWREL